MFISLENRTKCLAKTTESPVAAEGMNFSKNDQNSFVRQFYRNWNVCIFREESERKILGKKAAASAADISQQLWCKSLPENCTAAADQDKASQGHLGSKRVFLIFKFCFICRGGGQSSKTSIRRSRSRLVFCYFSSKVA
jgi:hypothetical protein